MDPRTRTEITTLLQRARAPGCAVATTRGESMYFGAASLEPARPVEATTRFHLFSGTKLYTAAAVLLLVDRGELSLDAPVRDALPDLPLSRPVTVRQLLSHTSGLGDTLRAFLAVHPGDRPNPSTATALSRYRLAKGGRPGRRARYRNVNYALLGEVITRVSGVPYETFVRRELLAPLGSGASFEVREGDAVGHVPRFSPTRVALPVLLPEATPWIRGPVAGGFLALRPFALDTAAIGGLIGTAGDLLPLLRETLSPTDGVLSATAKGEMLRVQAKGAVGIVSRDGVGLGWKRGRGFWNHEGGGPGFCTETRVYPGTGAGIVVLMNRSQSATLSRICHEICERLR